VTNVGSGSASAFIVDAGTGALTSAGPPTLAGTTPRSIAVDPSGRYLFVPNTDSDSISRYAVDADNGSLTPVGETAVPGSAPVAMAFAPAQAGNK